MHFAKRGDRWLLAVVAAGALSALLWFGLTMGATASAATGHGTHPARHHHAHHPARQHAHRNWHRGHGTASITSQPWGTANGQAVQLYTLRSGNGMAVRITNYGGVIQSIWVPGRTGTTSASPAGRRWS